MLKVQPAAACAFFSEKPEREIRKQNKRTSENEENSSLSRFGEESYTFLFSSMAVSGSRRGMCFLLPAGKSNGVSRLWTAARFPICPEGEIKRSFFYCFADFLE